MNLGTLRAFPLCASWPYCHGTHRIYFLKSKKSSILYAGYFGRCWPAGERWSVSTKIMLTAPCFLRAAPQVPTSVSNQKPDTQVKTPGQAISQKDWRCISVCCLCCALGVAACQELSLNGSQAWLIPGLTMIQARE